jgi:hypothetical protein
MYSMTNAVKSNDFKTFDYILSKNCDLKVKDYRDKTIFDYALDYQNHEVIKKLKSKI